MALGALGGAPGRPRAAGGAASSSASPRRPAATLVFARRACATPARAAVPRAARGARGAGVGARARHAAAGVAARVGRTARRRRGGAVPPGATRRCGARASCWATTSPATSRSPSSPRAAGVSRHRLTRLFRAAYGMPPHRFALAHRIRAARRLLERGVAPAEVAAADRVLRPEPPAPPLHAHARDDARAPTPPHCAQTYKTRARSAP